MSDLAAFEQRVRQLVEASDREPRWEPHEAARYMAEVRAKREDYERLAADLTARVIRPRLEAVARCFSNARLSADEPPNRCSCWFGYCERFPASAVVSFAIEHDFRYDQIIVAYRASMTPPLVRFSDSDRLPLARAEVADQAIEDWVEARLLDFLDAYLRIDRGAEDFDEDVVTDPVCGMRLSRSAAGASLLWEGQPYYFCSTDCRDRFVQTPHEYVASDGE